MFGSPGIFLVDTKDVFQASSVATDGKGISLTDVRRGLMVGAHLSDSDLTESDPNLIGTAGRIRSMC
jgi:hypothetical protein